MLEEILQTHKSKKIPHFENKNPEKNNKDHQYKEKSLFLNEEKCFDQKSKIDDIMNKYCTLYKEEIKPINHDFLNKKQRKVDRQKTAGENWFNLPSPELTPELKQDLKALELRGVINSKFYKNIDRDRLPKFFHVGTIQDNIIDGKNSRLKKNEVKERLLEEFLQEDIKTNYTKRKFDEFQDQRRKISLKKQKVNKYKLQNRKKQRKADFVVKN
jgi:hypothetical protein